MIRRSLLRAVLASALLGSSAHGDFTPVQIAADFPDARQPQAAVAPDGMIHIVLGVKHAIYCVSSHDSGKSYGSPARVGDAGQLALGMRRGPRIAATKEHVVVTAIGGERGGGKDGDVLAWRSGDRGKTWQGPVRINSVAGAAREGLQHLAASPDGTFYCVWNDLRIPRQMPIYGAASRDGGATWVDEKVVYAAPGGMICPCCQPVAGFDPKGRLLVMWRNSIDGNRDMYLTISEDGGRTFGKAQKLGQGTWPTDT
jgi:hypothetical protein